MVLVVVYHAGLPLHGGFVGVDIFFVISGFVITGMLHREWLASGRIRFGRFYFRRFKRLTPALALMVTVTVTISSLALSPLGPQQNVAATGAAAMLSVANVVLARTTGGYFGAQAEENPLLNTWSLSVEEQFYLAFPALLVIAWLVARRFPFLKGGAVALVTGAGVASFGLGLVGSMGVRLRGGFWLIGYYSPFTRAWEFAAGALLALICGRFRLASGKCATLLGLAGAGLLTLSVGIISDATPFPGPYSVLPVAATVLLLLAGMRPSNMVSRSLAVGPVVKLGDWSYSIYLWHWPLIAFAAMLWPDRPAFALLVAVFSLAPALCSFRWVEQPIRRLKELRRDQVVRLVTLTLIPPLLVASVLWLGSNRGWGLQSIRQAQAQEESSHVGWLECMTLTPNDGPGPQDPKSCHYNLAGTAPAISLVGDSNAAAYSEAALGAAHLGDHPLTVSTAAGCPLIDIYRGSLTGVTSGDIACRQFYEQTMAQLSGQPPGVVIIAESPLYWYSKTMTIGGSPNSQLSDAAGRSGDLRAGLLSTVNDLQRSGHRVVLVMPAYVFDDPADRVALQTCPLWSVLGENCPAPISMSEVNPAQAQARADVQAVAQATGSATVDISAHQCPMGQCGAYFDGTPVYMNVAHISSSLSELLVPDFASAIAESG